MVGRVPASVTLLFVFGWFILHPYSWHWNGIAVNGSYIMALLCAIIAWMLIGDGGDRLHTLSVAFLIAAIYVFFAQLYRTSPILILYSQTTDLALIAAAAAVVFCRRPMEQWTVLTIGLWLGDALLGQLWGSTSEPQLGHAALYDLWWFAFAIARLVSVVVTRIVIRVKNESID